MAEGAQARSLADLLPEEVKPEPVPELERVSLDLSQNVTRVFLPEVQQLRVHDLALPVPYEMRPSDGLVPVTVAVPSEAPLRIDISLSKQGDSIILMIQPMMGDLEFSHDRLGNLLRGTQGRLRQTLSQLRRTRARVTQLQAFTSSPPVRTPPDAIRAAEREQTILSASIKSLEQQAQTTAAYLQRIQYYQNVAQRLDGTEIRYEILPSDIAADVE